MEKQSFKGVPESNWVVGPCRTEEIAKQVLAVAHAYGWEWQSGLSFIRATHFFSSICYNLIKGRESSIAYYDKAKYQIISPEIFLANNPMPKEKTRKPGVKYTLDDWKKEADACRKRAEYWRDKFHASEKTANSVADSMTEVLKTHEKLQLDLDHTNKNYLILQAENKGLKESNDQLRKWNNEQVKTIESAQKEAREMYKRNLDLDEELKTVKSHLDLRTKGIQVLEHDAKLNRIEIASLKYDFETKNSELEILEEDYNCLKDVQKYTKVVGWAGWILFFIALFGLMFFKG